MGFSIIGHPSYDTLSEEHINRYLGMFFRSWINSLNYENYVNSVFNLDLKIYSKNDKKPYQLDENDIITSKTNVNNHIIWELKTLKGLSIWIESIFDFYNLDKHDIESYKNEVERNDKNFNGSEFINFITEYKNNNSIGVMKKTSKLIEFQNNVTPQQKKYILILMYLDYAKTEDFLNNKYDHSINQITTPQPNLQLENSIEFFNKVNQNLVSELDVLNFIERATNDEKHKLEILAKDIETFEIDFISNEVVDSYFSVHNVKSVSELFTRFKELVFNKINKQPQQINNSKNKIDYNQELNKAYFKVGLMFAKNEIYSKVVTIENIKSTKYYHNNNEFPNINQLAKHLGLTRQYINDSFNNSSSHHNIFNNKNKLKMIIGYCKERSIDINKDFLDKYALLSQEHH
ncbi:hypothetical protein [Flavobacterium sp.]|uniref:hypothetical protein n=1 Tax=Flavobacterium sp. TaxID=239 RepID=UPI003751F9E2